MIATMILAVLLRPCNHAGTAIALHAASSYVPALDLQLPQNPIVRAETFYNRAANDRYENRPYDAIDDDLWAARLAAVLPANSLASDVLLRSAFDLYVSGHRAQARHIWRQFLGEHAEWQAWNAAAMLGQGRSREFFSWLSLYSKNINFSPTQNDRGRAWFDAGIRAGENGNVSLAQKRFEESTYCENFGRSHPLLAWGAAAFFRGDRASAEAAWLVASETGIPSDAIPFSAPVNGAAASFLLWLYRS
jgi:hypothetical protein